MKRNKLLYVLLPAVLLLASCDKYLDVIPDSRTEVDTPEKISGILVSAYPISTPFTLFEIRSDNVIDNGTQYTYNRDYTRESYLFQEVTAISQDTPYWQWSGYYNAIAAANLALESIAELEDPSLCDPQKGEALVCRAYAHYLLVNAFCQAYNPQSSNTDLGIPYMEKTETTAVNYYERGTVAGVYEKIARDLEEGIPLIKEDLYSQPKYHFNLKAAYAFAAEFYLFYGDYVKAEKYATLVLGDNPAAVLRDLDAFTGLTADERSLVYARSSEQANLILIANTSYIGVDLVSTGNYRYAHSSYISNNETVKTYGPWGNNILSFYTSLYGATEQRNYVPKYYNSMREYYTSSTIYYKAIFRAFTMERTLLARAEAYVMQDLYDKAAADLCTWYSHYNRSTVSVDAQTISDFYASANKTLISKPLNPRHEIKPGMQENMIQACIHARRIETVHDGIRYFDLKRFGISYTHTVADGEDIILEPFDKRLPVEIPSAVVSAGMTPNP